MKVKTIHQLYQEAIDQIKSRGKVKIQEELNSLEKELSLTKGLNNRIGLIGKIAMMERALRELE